MKYFLIFILTISLMGCGSTRIKYVDRYQTVDVEKPVFKVPEEIIDMEELSRPKLEYTNLTEDDSDNPDKVIKAAIKSILQLETYAKQREIREKKILEALREAEKRSVEDK